MAKICDEDVRRLVAAQMNDYEIGAALGVHHDTVRRRRRRMGLKSPGRKYRRREKRGPLGSWAGTQAAESETCRACRYRGSCAGLPCCDYIGIIGHSRGCPPGTGCLVFRAAEAESGLS